MSKAVKAIGFWFEHDGNRQWPHPRYLVDWSWRPRDRNRIVDYLKKGTLHTEYLGFAECRFFGRTTDKTMGASDLSDGVWLWPEGLAVYVDEYGVRLPEEFVEHVLSTASSVNDTSSSEPCVREIDFEYWEQWCQREVPQTLIRTVRSHVATWFRSNQI